MGPELHRNPAWDQLLNAVTEARTTIIVGAVDTGKTTLVQSIADEIGKAGRTCGIVDADMGQSDIGPPTTIGLGAVRGPIKALGQAELIAIYFVGSISPNGYILQTVAGTKKMVERAQKMDLDHILVDTTGLIHGHLGETLKGHKIELIEPDLLIFLERESECGHLIGRFRNSSILKIIILSPSNDVRNKTPIERREYRQKAFLSYFSKACIKKIDLNGLYLVGFQLFWGLPYSEKERKTFSEKIDDVVVWAESVSEELHLVTVDPMQNLEQKRLKESMGKDRLFIYTLDDFENILVGIYDKHGECFSLGIIKEIDFHKKSAVVEIADDREDIFGLKFSRYKMEGYKP